MDVVDARCCGLAVHQRLGVACLLPPGARGQPRQEVRPCGTMTAAVLALADGLAAVGGTHVAMEGTGGSWKPIGHVLAERFAVLLGNARQVQAVPVRQTAVQDAAWLADWLRHGLLTASDVPDRDQRELPGARWARTRSRTALLRARAAEANRRQQPLAEANLQRAAVATASTGTSGPARRIPPDWPRWRASRR